MSDLKPSNYPLHDCIRNGDIETGTRLIISGADINAKDNMSRSALHIAAWKVQYNVIMLKDSILFSFIDFF